MDMAKQTMAKDPCGFCWSIFGQIFFLIIVDAHSKWSEVYEMTSTTSANTISVLRHVFNAHGLPLQLVSDNGPQFVSVEFAQFLKANGVKHIRSSPYHPSSNGLAERFKQAMKAAWR